MRRVLLISAVVVAGVLAAGVAVIVTRAPAPIPPASQTVGSYLAAWNRRDWPAMVGLVDHPPPDFAATNAGAFDGLSATAATFSAGPIDPVPGGMVAAFTARMTLSGLGPWSYDGRIPLVIVHRHWLVRWSPAVIHPDLGPGLHLGRTRTMPARAPILAADGTPLHSVTGAGDLIGDTAPATAATAARLGPPYLPGDVAGTSGLERTYNDQLAGRPSGDVVVLDDAGRTVRAVYHFPGAAPQPLVTTVNPAIQADAARVLAPVAHPAALVAIDTATGGVQAIVSHPIGGYPRALVGTYAPGSTFKVVTATAALEAGWTPASPIDCPPSITVGKTFTNAEHEQFGTISFQQAFAQSCNTAFIGIASKLTDAQLEAAAATYGLGEDWPFPVSHFGGDLPPPASRTEHAADAIGQGRVSVSPLQMCSIAAAVARGAWEPPRLVAAAGGGDSHPLPPAVDADLQTFMRAVVTGGTGTAANLPGAPVYGKTGTAEFGTGNPPQTHAWFIGWRGTTAFAVVVEDGGFGGSAAAPLAAEFLSGLP